MASPRAGDVIALKRVAFIQSSVSRMACRYAWTEMDSNIEVFGDANFAGCISTRKSTVGGVALWSGQFVKAWSQTMGILALSSVEFELTAVVRAATEGVGLQPLLSDFGLCSTDSAKESTTFSFGDLWVQHHVRSRKMRVSKMLP